MSSGELAGSLGADFTPHEIIVCPGEYYSFCIMLHEQELLFLHTTHMGGKFARGEYKILSLSGEFIPISFEGTGYVMKFFLQSTLEAADGTEIKDDFTVMKAVSPVQVVVGSSITRTSA